MVVFNPANLLALLAQQADPKPALPEPVKQFALMALLGIALLGMFIVLFTLLGGHWVRRLGDRVRGKAVPPDMILPRTRKSSQPHVNDLPGEPGDTLGTDETIA